MLAILGAAHAAQAGDWPQFLGPTRNGVSLEHLPPSFPAAGPAVLWKTDVGHGFAGPAVVQGRLVLFHRVHDQERVECFDAMSGKPLWHSDYETDYVDDFGFDDGPRATPSIAGGRIFTFGASGMLCAWDLPTGKQIWATNTRTAFKSEQGFFGRACSPLVEGNLVILNIGAEGAGVAAFDCATGRVFWKATDDAAGYSSPVAATIGGRRYILSLTREGLVTLDPATGKVFSSLHFRSRMDASVNAATPLVLGDNLFLSASYDTGAELLKFEEAGPKKIWASDDALSNHYATSVAFKGMLFGFDGRQEQGPNLRCIEAGTGKVLWSEDHFGAGSILLVGDDLMIVTEKGELVVAPASGEGFKVRSRAQVLPFGVRAYPAISDGLFYARGIKEMICLDLRQK